MQHVYGHIVHVYTRVLYSRIRPRVHMLWHSSYCRACVRIATFKTSWTQGTLCSMLLECTRVRTPVHCHTVLEYQYSSTGTGTGTLNSKTFDIYGMTGG